MAQQVKNLPAVQEMWVRTLNWEDPLNYSMATHSSILAWRIPTDTGTWQATEARIMVSLSHWNGLHICELHFCVEIN